MTLTVLVADEHRTIVANGMHAGENDAYGVDKEDALRSANFRPRARPDSVNQRTNGAALGAGLRRDGARPSAVSPSRMKNVNIKWLSPRDNHEIHCGLPRSENYKWPIRAADCRHLTSTTTAANDKTLGPSKKHGLHASWHRNQAGVSPCRLRKSGNDAKAAGAICVMITSADAASAAK